jgi:small-conductance mechanosensitive channel
MSQRDHSKRFSREGFQPLTHHTSNEMTNPNDITIDIPLTKVTTAGSTTGARKIDATSPSTAQYDEGWNADQMNEKQGHRFLRGPGGRRRRLENMGRQQKEKEDGSLNAVGRFYKKVYNFSVLTRYFIYVAPLALAIAVPIIVGATVAPRARIGGVKIVWFFTWVEVVWCSLWASKMVAHYMPFLFQFICGVVSAGTRKYALVLSSLEIPLSLVGWAVTSLATFVPLMTLNPDQRSRGDTGLKDWERTVKNILFACVFSTLLLLGEKVLIQLLSISYHRKQFDDKIKDSKRNIYLVGLLYEASRKLFPEYSKEFLEEDYMINDVLDLAERNSNRNSLRPGHKRSGSATPMRLIQNVARVGDKVTAAFGNVAHEITGKKVFNSTASHSIVVQALEKKAPAEALARRLWMSFVLEGKDALTIEDIVDVLGHEREQEAHEAFEVLDVDSNGDISLEEMILRITEFGRERQSIANSMHDVDQAINVLDNLLCFVVFIAVIFIFVAWLNRNFTTTLATAGTALLSMSFVFASTAAEVLGSCIFLFVKHPFDVGDRVDVSEVQYIVERMSLLYTVFRRVKDHKRTQVPNIVLNSVWIDNVSRSKAMRERIPLFVDFGTSFEDLDLLKKEMTDFVRDKDNARDFQPDIDIEVIGVAEMNKMEIQIEIRHKSNWANEAIRAARRSKFMCALVLATRKVPIAGPAGNGPAAGSAANPNYSVTISDDNAKKNREDFDLGADKKRLVPLKEQNQTSAVVSRLEALDVAGTTGSEAREASAVDHLIKRNVAVDPEDMLDQDRELHMDKQRSNDVEDVRNILRRESTVGRRRAGRNSGLQIPGSESGSRTIPTVPEPSPPELASATHSNPPRVSYFEDSQNNAQGSNSRQDWATVTPLNYSQPTSSSASRPSAQPNSPPMTQVQTTLSPTQYVPGNAFSQRAYASPPSGRPPVPGMSQMKNHLRNQSPPSPPK